MALCLQSFFPPKWDFAVQGIVGSFEAAPQLWEGWWRSPEPETTELPGEWEPKCDELQRMILLRCLRSLVMLSHEIIQIHFMFL